MSAHINDGGPAFPEPIVLHNDRWEPASAFTGERGMSLRDYFAIEALPLSAAAHHDHQDGKEGICRDAYKWADAMLKARQSNG